jgi:hypothetical protein
LHRFSIFCPGYKCGHKWNLLKFREGKYKRDHCGTRWKLKAGDFLFARCVLKLTVTYGKGRAW